MLSHLWVYLYVWVRQFEIYLSKSAHKCESDCVYLREGKKSPMEKCSRRKHIDTNTSVKVSFGELELMRITHRHKSDQLLRHKFMRTAFLLQRWPKRTGALRSTCARICVRNVAHVLPSKRTEISLRAQQKCCSLASHRWVSCATIGEWIKHDARKSQRWAHPIGPSFMDPESEADSFQASIET